MKKIEASLIKRLLRISSQFFVNSVLELSHYPLSHTLGHLEFSWRILALEQGSEKKAKEGQGKERKV